MPKRRTIELEAAAMAPRSCRWRVARRCRTRPGVRSRSAGRI